MHSSLAILLATAALSSAADPSTPLKIDPTLEHSCIRSTKSGDTVNVHYRGTLLATGTEFDSSYNRGQPLSFPLGAGRVIKGWDQGLLDMCPGDKRVLTIPPELGYGSREVGPIPAGSTLVFETELVSIAGVEPEAKVVRSAKSAVSAATETVKSAASAAGESVASATSIASESAASAASAVSGGAADAAEAVKESASSAGSVVSSGASSAASVASESASSATSVAGESAASATSVVGDAAESVKSGAEKVASVAKGAATGAVEGAKEGVKQEL